MNYRFSKYLILSILLIIYSCSLENQEPFSFVQICDTQLGMGGYIHDVQTFKQAVTQINASNADFVVICCDLVNDATDSSFTEFEKIVNEISIPYYLAPGNHDVGKIPNDSTLSYYRNMIGKDYFDFTYNGYSFIITNSQLWKSYIGDESDKHDTWFKNLIENKKKNDIPIFIIGHYPLFTEKPEEDEHYFNFPSDKRSELLELFSKNNVVAYLSGHTHKLTINDYNGAQLVSGESTSKNFDNRPLGFRIWSVIPDSVIHNFVPVDTLVLMGVEAAID